MSEIKIGKIEFGPKDNLDTVSNLVDWKTMIEQFKQEAFAAGFKAGAEAMREMAAKEAETLRIYAMEDENGYFPEVDEQEEVAKAIRSLPLPEVK